MGLPIIQQSFDLAVRHHQAGRLGAAEAAYRQILAQQPEHADALHMLGVIAHQVKRLDVAVELIGRAIARQPNWPEAYYNLGNALKDAGQVDRAIAAFRQAIALKASWAEAYNNLGNALRDAGQVDEAVAAWRWAIALQSDYAEAYSNLGAVLQEQGQFDQAAAACRQAIALKPDCPEACCNLGTALKSAGQLAPAIAAYRQAIAIKPNYPEAYSNLGAALQEHGQVDDAVAACRQALALRPGYAEAHLNLSNALQDQGQLAQAIGACRQALALRPNYANAYVTLGNVLQDQGQMDQAIAAYRQAIALKPEYPDAHWNLALALLLTGELAGGWEEFEWRLKMPSLGLNRGFAQKQWDGADPAGKTILLHAEGGFGDALQFVRLVPRLRGRGATFVLECQPALAPLLAQVAGIERIIARGQPLPPFDWHSPLQSLPRILGITLENIPGTVPYLTAPSQRARQWAARVPRDGQLNVGLVWAGSSGHRRLRSRSLAIFQPLAAVAGVRFFSLQKGPEAAQKPPEGIHLIDHTAELHDFADTAALVQHLDLVISVDTSIAHLAGAMARPVWVLIPARGDFRWLLRRNDSPWYPTMRLFRQPSIGDWNSVMPQLAAALAELKGSGRVSKKPS